ncbi:hypothetical protein GGF41_008056, partial [Coemansia sp. RSA 2531]
EQAEQQKNRDEVEVQRYIEREVGLSKTTTNYSDSSDIVTSKRPLMIEFNDSSKRRAIESKDKEAVVTKEKPKLPSFWIPSLAPTAKSTVSDPSKLSVQCQASSPAHSLKLKHLVEVQFRTSSKGEKLCPSCDKPLLNSTKVS